MITDMIINLFLFLPYQLLQGLSSFEFNLTFPDNVFEAFKDMVVCVDYLVPVSIFVACFSLKLAIRFWSLPYTIIIRIKSFIPTMGD